MNQGNQHPLADAYMHLEAAKLATYHAARLFDGCSNTRLTRLLNCRSQTYQNPDQLPRKRFNDTPKALMWVFLDELKMEIEKYRY